MNTIQQYKMTGYIRGLTKVASAVPRNILVKSRKSTIPHNISGVRRLVDNDTIMFPAESAAWRQKLMQNQLLLLGYLLLDVLTGTVGSTTKKPTAKPDKPKKRRTTQLVNADEGYLPYKENVRPVKGSKNKTNDVLVTEAVPRQAPPDDGLEQLLLFKHMPDGSLVPAIKARKLPSSVLAQARIFGRRSPLAAGATNQWYDGLGTYDWDGSPRAARIPFAGGTNPVQTRRRFRAWLRDTYNKHPKLVIGSGATAAGAGTAALISALMDDDTPAPVLPPGPVAKRELPKRRYTPYGYGDVDRNHSNWNWHNQQFADSAKGRAGALARAARELAAADIPLHLSYRAALLQSFKDPNVLGGGLLITKERLAHAARQQAILWLKHLGIPPSEYNISQMAKYFSDYSRFALIGGMLPDVQLYFRHLDTANYKLALKTLIKWRKAVSHGF